MALWKEFKQFLLKGNVIELAVAVIIGTAFGNIVSSLVDDVITPLLLKPALDIAQADKFEELKAGGVLYGKFIAAVIKFIIFAFVLFLVIKLMSSILRKKEETPSGPSSTDQLLMEIRDELKKKNQSL